MRRRVRLGWTGRILLASAAGLGAAAFLSVGAGRADPLPPPPTVTLPPAVDVTVPGLGVGVHVDLPPAQVPTGSGPASGAPSLPSPPSSPSSSAAPAGPPGPAPTSAAAPAPPTSAANGDQRPEAAKRSPTSRSNSRGRPFGTAVADVVTEPRTLVSALALALGVGVVAGAGTNVPRYRRRQRELLERWARASEQERSAATRLAEADTQKSEFLALVAHELRTPLTAVKGFVDTVLLHWDRLAEDRQRELLTRASTNADELARLVGQLLDFARSDVGSVQVIPTPLDVRDAIRNVLRDLAPVVAEHRVEIDVPDGLTVTADADAFSHVLVNLLTNAVKFSPPDSRISVRAESDVGSIRIAVTDEGSGVPLDEQQRIFDRFYQARDSRAHGRRGTGIGLAIAQRFTELQGGRIGVKSEPGHGSTFWFTLPRAHVAMLVQQGA